MTAREVIDDVRAGGDVGRHAWLYGESDEACEAFREEVVALLWREHDARDLLLVRALVTVETALALEYDGCSGTLQALAFLLYRLGAEYDVLAIWGAKTANFDAGCMLDARLLTMGRDRGTMLAFVDADATIGLRHPGLREALVAAYRDGTYDNDDDFRASVAGYFNTYFGVD
jgi:hypothetical protein